MATFRDKNKQVIPGIRHGTMEDLLDAPAGATVCVCYVLPNTATPASIWVVDEGHDFLDRVCRLFESFAIPARAVRVVPLRPDHPASALPPGG